MLLYDYGWLAWVWRVLGGAGLAAGIAIAAYTMPGGHWGLALVGLPLVLPALVLMPMVGVRVVRLPDDVIQVDTLVFLRRRIPIARLGAPRFKEVAYSNVTPVYAPRVWIPVRGSLWPIYLDLLARVPDRQAFLKVFPVGARVMPRSHPPDYGD